MSPEGGDDTPPADDSRRIYVRPQMGPQSAHGYSAGSQRAYSLGQLRHWTDRQTERRYRLVPPKAGA